MESVSIQGVCKPLEAVFAIIGVELEEDKDFSFSRYPHPLSLFKVAS